MTVVHLQLQLKIVDGVIMLYEYNLILRYELLFIVVHPPWLFANLCKHVLTRRNRSDPLLVYYLRLNAYVASIPVTQRMSPNGSC